MESRDFAEKFGIKARWVNGRVILTRLTMGWESPTGSAWRRRRWQFSIKSAKPMNAAAVLRQQVPDLRYRKWDFETWKEERGNSKTTRKDWKKMLRRIDRFFKLIRELR